MLNLSKLKLASNSTFYNQQKKNRTISIERSIIKAKIDLKKTANSTLTSFPKIKRINRSRSVPLLTLLNRKKEYCKLQVKFLQVPENKRKTTIIGNQPIEFLQPDKFIPKPFIRMSIFDRLKLMKGFGEYAKKHYMVNNNVAL